VLDGRAQNTFTTYFIGTIEIKNLKSITKRNSHGKNPNNVIP
jgi:hypothetical protein